MIDGNIKRNNQLGFKFQSSYVISERRKTNEKKKKTKQNKTKQKKVTKANCHFYRYDKELLKLKTSETRTCELVDFQSHIKIYIVCYFFDIKNTARRRYAK